MKEQNIKTLENLSVFCYFSGAITVFLGVVVIFMDLINGDIRHVQVGIFIFIVGYAFVKISSKIAAVFRDEQQSYF